MRLPEKTDALYVKGVVIANNIPDAQGDVLTKEDIKKVFTNYLDNETDIQHNFVKNFNVYPLENTITESEDYVIANEKIPKGSWIASYMVIDPDIKQMILDNKVNGFSLGSVKDAGLGKNQNFINKSITYNSLKDSEEINPLFISFVDNPANGYKWEWYDYTDFIQKSKKNYDDNRIDTMTELNENDKAMSLLEKAMDFFITKGVKEDEQAKTTEPAHAPANQAAPAAPVEKPEDKMSKAAPTEPTTDAKPLTVADIPALAEAISQSFMTALKKLHDEKESEEETPAGQPPADDTMNKACATDDKMNKACATDDKMTKATPTAKVDETVDETKMQKSATRNNNGINDPNTVITKSAKLDSTSTNNSNLSGYELFCEKTGRNPITGEKQ
jgi:hypothetical protein